MFTDLKAKQQKYITEISYDDILEQIIAGMFVFEGLPDTVNAEFIPIYCMREGLCAFVNNVENGGVGHCAIGGKPDLNGIGKDAIVSFDNGVVKKYPNWRTNEHIVVMFNDVLMRPNLNIGRYAAMLTEIDTSTILNIIYSRYLPVPVAKDDEQRKALDEILNTLIKGDKLKTLVSDNMLDELLTGEKRPIDIINISDVENADKIQYLLKAHDDIMRRFYGLYGMDVNGASKMAQQTVAEIGSAQGASMILPYNMLTEAQKAVDEMRRKFGWNVTVKFNRPWEYDLNNNGVLDVLEEESTDENTDGNVDKIETEGGENESKTDNNNE